MVFMDLALLIDSSLDDDVFKVCRRDWLCMVHEESAEDMKNMVGVVSLLHFKLVTFLTEKKI